MNQRTLDVPAVPPPATTPRLVRGLGTWDGALITIGSILGTGIFITTGDMARVLPHAGLILLVWIAGGLVTIAGALTYGELGVLFPRAGGQYHFLKEAYGPLPGFLYGWAAFLVYFSGGVAALAVGFGEYLGSFVPFLSMRNVLLSVPLGEWTWTLSGGQLSAVAAILFLTAINYLGLREGAGLQNVVTVVKVGSIVALVGLGLLAPAVASTSLTEPLPAGSVLVAFGVAMIAGLWAYDGWANLTYLGGEMRRPERSLPFGLILGCLAVVLLYTLLNLVYIRALPVGAMSETPRIAETAAATLFGPGSARLVSLAVLISTFGCLSANILAGARIYYAMAQDGLFFRSLAAVHPRHFVPGRSLWAQGAWSAVLALSGTYEQLYIYVIFIAVLFNAAAGASVFVLRRTRPELPRPYRAWGYPVVPLLFILALLLLVVNTLLERPVESLWGLAFVALGVPAYLWWRRGKSRTLQRD
jgi:APA family basic amino acid/polyamine antiporter